MSTLSPTTKFLSRRNVPSYFFCRQTGCKWSSRISLSGWFEIQWVNLSSLQWLVPHLHSSTYIDATECNKNPKHPSTCTLTVSVKCISLNTLSLHRPQRLTTGFTTRGKFQVLQVCIYLRWILHLVTTNNITVTITGPINWLAHITVYRIATIWVSNQSCSKFKIFIGAAENKS